MNRLWRRVRATGLLGCAALCAASGPGQDAKVAFPGGRFQPAVVREAPASPALGGAGDTAFPLETLYHSTIENRLGLGLRLTRFRLNETKRPADTERLRTFVGYVNELREEDATALWPVLTYHVNDYVGVEITWGEVAARTYNFNTGLSDGVVRMSGPILEVTAQYPVFGYLCPYLGLGYAPWKASFDHAAWWRLGWLTPEAYEAAGSPPDREGERPRLMAVEDDSGVVFTLGLTVRLHRYVDLDLLVRRMSLDSKVRHYRGDPLVFEREGSFPLDHTVFGVGVHGVF